jgi:hypothetical protein
MASTCKHHHELDEMGEGRCSVPMWSNGCPDGFCDAPAYGKRLPTTFHTRWDGYVYADDGGYAGYVPALACPMHGGPKVRTFMDGNAWCAVRPDFIDLQASPAGFGATREQAIAELERTP